VTSTQWGGQGRTGMHPLPHPIHPKNFLQTQKVKQRELKRKMEAMNRTWAHCTSMWKTHRKPPGLGLWTNKNVFKKHKKTQALEGEIHLFLHQEEILNSFIYNYSFVLWQLQVDSCFVLFVFVLMAILSLLCLLSPVFSHVLPVSLHLHPCAILLSYFASSLLFPFFSKPSLYLIICV
jgi:hypothetical protein